MSDLQDAADEVLAMYGGVVEAIPQPLLDCMDAARLVDNPNIIAVEAVLWGVHGQLFDAKTLAKQVVDVALTPPGDDE